MKKFVLLVLGIVLFSGVAGAKLYWLPDYQNEDMKAKERISDADNNRNSGCPSGTYPSPKDSSRWNCSYSSSIASSYHLACYSCTAKACASGVIQSSCNTANGYTWKANGYYSGDNPCGSCNPTDCSAYKKKSECITSNGYTYVQKCKSAGVDYGTCNPNRCSGVAQSSCNTDCYTFTSNGCKSAGVNYGTCSAKPCPAGYTAGITECSNGYAIMTSGCSGTKTCGRCDVKACPSGEMSKTDCFNKSGGSSTWTWKSSGSMGGTTACGTCVKTCPDGYNSGTTICGSGQQLSTIYNQESGFLCGKCENCGFNICSSTERCAENSYVTDVNQCGFRKAAGWELGAPAKKCGNTTYYFCQKIGCDTYGDASYVTKSQCTNGSFEAVKGAYSGDDECGSCITSCPTGYSTAYQNVNDCGSSGDQGWVFEKNGSIGSKVCGKCTKKSCDKSGGWIEADMYKHCTPTNWNWEFTPVPAINGKYQYSGDDICGTCVLKCDTPCTSYTNPTSANGMLGEYLPYVSGESACARGAAPGSADFNGGCCFRCDPLLTYSNMGFNSINNFGNDFKYKLQECLHYCNTIATSAFRTNTDEEMCYTMCLVAKQHRLYERVEMYVNAGQTYVNVEDSDVLYCPSNMKRCCGSSEGTDKPSLDNTDAFGVTWKAFTCGVPYPSNMLPLPSCKYDSCSGW